MSDRRLHVIGSYPAATAEAAMSDMLSRAAPQLAYLPDGETGERRDWIVHIINGLRVHPDLRVRKEGDWSDYEHQLNFAVRSKHRLRGESLDFGHTAAYTAARPAFERLRLQHGRPDLPFQIGIPGDLDMAMFTLGPTGPFTHRRPFTDAAVREITDIHAVARADVVFQIAPPSSPSASPRSRGGPSRRPSSRCARRGRSI